MNKRLELDEKFSSIPGVSESYFQPPPSIQMTYPCIRYSRDEDFNLHADDMRYYCKERYSVVVIDPDPDSEIPQHILDVFKYCRMTQFYTSNNLNHWNFTLYF